MSLPTTRKFITQLLESLPAVKNCLAIGAGAGENSNPLSGVPESAKNQLLALQVLFPNEFLPALDLLDRGLVTRLRVNGGEGGVPNHERRTGAGAEEEGRRDGEDTGSRDVNMQDASESAMEQTYAQPEHSPTDVSSHTAQSPSEPATYYVRSAQQRSSRYSSSYDTTTSYEVRLLAWNCSCPAFAFAAFPAVHPEPIVPVYDPHDYITDEEAEEGTAKAWMFGGASLGDAIPPVCKHLLACVLVEKCAGLFGGYVEERVVSVEEAAGWAAGWGD